MTTADADALRVGADADAEAQRVAAIEADAARAEAVMDRQDERAGRTKRNAPERHKARDDWTVEDILDHRRTGEQPERDEYREYVRRVHEAAGLGRPDGEPIPVDEMTPDDHARQIRRRPAR